MNRRSYLRVCLIAAASVLSVAVFLYLTLPRVPWGPVTGTGQDEWYNVNRSLRALYEFLHPSYFVHPALYYEILAAVFGIEHGVLRVIGGLTDGTTFLDYYLAHDAQFLDHARYVSLACGALAVAAAVWLGTLLSTVTGGLLVGLIVASLPLMRALSTCIRVDALALATYILAAALLVRWHRCPTRRTWWAACGGIGVAASANYPGALLLLVVAWLEWVRGEAGSGQRLGRIARASGVAFAVFLALNPYVLLDARQFLRWFLFQAELPLYKHPYAPEPSPWLYLEVLRDQGPAAMAASVAGVLTIVRPRTPCGALALFALVQIVGFSLMQTQYDRFVLPAITVLCIAGASGFCALLATWAGSRLSALFALAVAAAVVWVTVTQAAAVRPLDVEADYRAEMFAWIETNVSPAARLVIESDTLPLVQSVYDRVDRGLRFQAALRQAFEKRHPRFVANVLKSQFIAAVYNYDSTLLDAADVYFLASSQNREFVAANSDLLPEPMRFYALVDARASVVHETGGFREKLLLYAVRGASGM